MTVQDTNICSQIRPCNLIQQCQVSRIWYGIVYQNLKPGLVTRPWKNSSTWERLSASRKLTLAITFRPRSSRKVKDMRERMHKDTQMHKIWLMKKTGFIISSSELLREYLPIHWSYLRVFFFPENLSSNFCLASRIELTRPVDLQSAVEDFTKGKTRCYDARNECQNFMCVLFSMPAC